MVAVGKIMIIVGVFGIVGVGEGVCVAVGSGELVGVQVGGKTTVLKVFVAKQHRHPATYYVSVSYMCWACRRKTMTIKNGEAIYD